MAFNLSKAFRVTKNIHGLASRRSSMFNYPHSYSGVNSALTNIPQKDVYPQIPRDAKPGDKAHFAH